MKRLEYKNEILVLFDWTFKKFTSEERKAAIFGNGNVADSVADSWERIWRLPDAIFAKYPEYGWLLCQTLASLYRKGISQGLLLRYPKDYEKQLISRYGSGN